jgi:hypothetical protein
MANYRRKRIYLDCLETEDTRMNLKRMKIVVLASLLAGVVGVGLTRAQETQKEAQPKKADIGAPPAVTGAWTGDWGMYSPPPKNGEQPPALKKMMYPEQCKQLDCKVEVLPDGKWQATFEGECGRPYKYTIKMPGRQAGNVVLFQGSADLGEKDGGVFDWIGRASDKEFVGFFTSKGYTGTFRLGRAK